MLSEILSPKRTRLQDAIVSRISGRPRAPSLGMADIICATAINGEDLSRDES